MSDIDKELFGSWTQAIGTIVAAVADTPSTRLTPEQVNQLGLYGNALQATGNGIMADTSETGSMNQAGNAIQAAGNTIIVGALILPLDETVEQNLIIKGNLFQATGGAVTFNEDLKEDVSTAALYAVIGDFLQIVGNATQAYAAISDFIVDDHEERLNSVGSWIQAVGAVLSALSITKALPSSDNEPEAEELANHA